MKLSKITRAALVTLGLMASALSANAQQYPAKPVKLLVGFAAGGATDALARLYANKLTEILKTAVVENKPGAQELLAAQPVMAAAPDGYTLWFGTSSALGQAPGVRTDLPYDTLKNFTLIARAADAEAVFAVKNTVPVNSFAEFVAYAKKNPGKLNYGSAGVGAANHLLTEYLKTLTGMDLVYVCAAPRISNKTIQSPWVES